LFKKRIISAFLLCVFAIVFAHSIIPHHHHEDEATEQHNSSHYNDHDDIDDNFLAQAFSHFQHDQVNGVLYETATPTLQCSKINFDKDIVLFAHYLIKLLHIPPLIYHEYSSFSFVISSCSPANLFRGPPASVA
jgi:hypothetical protein